jgi:GNAT superfamily N-acetyltransferase
VYGGASMKLDLRIPTDSPAVDGYWTPRTASKRAVDVIREQGPTALWFKLLGQTVYRRLTVYELRLDRPLPEVGPAIRAELGFLDPEDVEAYLELRPQESLAQVQERLLRGHRCLSARVQGRIVHVRWSSTESVPVAALGCTFRLAPGNELGYGTFTHPDFRRFGLARAVRTEMMRRLGEEGITRSLAIVEPENPPAVRFYERLGLRRIGTIGSVGAGRARLCFCRTNRGEPAPGSICRGTGRR